MLSELELKAYSLEWGNPSFATDLSILYEISDTDQARSQPARWGGGSELGWVEHQAHPPPWALSA